MSRTPKSFRYLVMGIWLTLTIILLSEINILITVLLS